MAKNNQKNNENGFTIVELMIALSVMSVILVLSTIMMIRIGSLYTKGVNMASLQNSTRTIMAELTSSIQFSGNLPTCIGASPDPACSKSFIGGLNVAAYCIGTTRYSYVLNRELGIDTDGSPQVYHVLWRDTMKDLSGCQPLDLSASTVLTDSKSAGVAGNSKGYDMVPTHMRLTKFSMAESPANSGVYAVDVWMAYGDSDLVNTVGGKTTCNGGTGSQFCAVSLLSTSVKNRIQ